MAKQDAWFILNRDAVINKVTLNDEVIEFKFEVDSPSPSIYIDDGRKLSLSLKSLRGNSSKSTLSIDYVVPIASVNYLESSQHIETGLYKAWFPLNFSYSQFPFRVSLDGLTHQVAGNGIVQIKYKRILLTNHGESIDIVLMTSPSLSTKTFKAADSQIQFIFFENSQDVESKLEEFVNKTLVTYQNAFSSNTSDTQMLQFAFVPRKSGPSYSRNGFAVLTQSEEPMSPLFVKTLAHEIAHFCWNKAATDNWQDWLNESFAEFSALMAIEHIFGKEMKDKFLMEFESLSSTLPP